jgi:heme A synthase
MLAGAVVFLCLAALLTGTGLRARRHPRTNHVSGRVLAMVVPTQLAAAAILAGGAAAALAAPASVGPPALLIAGAAALATIAAGSWQGARYAARLQSEPPAAGCDSGGGCGGCDRLCER